MRLIKTFGLAVIAVAAVMAFVGVSSAMATELEEVVICKKNIDPCLEGGVSQAFPANTKIDAELVAGTKAKLSTSLGTIQCTEATASGETTTTLAHGSLTAATFGTCTLGTTSCTVTVEHLPLLLKGELNAAHNGYEALLTSGGGGQPQAHVSCLGIINCEYGAPTILFTAESNAADTVLSVSQELNGIGTCGTNPVWTAQYLTRCLEPAGTFVSCWLKME